MSDSGHTHEQRLPSEWTRQEHHDRLRMLIQAATHPNATHRRVVLEASEAAAIADLLIAASLPPETPSGGQELKCSDCGGEYRYDISIASTLWNRVIRENGPEREGELLCGACIIAAFVKAGQPFTAHLSGDDLSGCTIHVEVNGKVVRTAEPNESVGGEPRLTVRRTSEAPCDSAALTATDTAPPPADAGARAAPPMLHQSHWWSHSVYARGFGDVAHCCRCHVHSFEQEAGQLCQAQAALASPATPAKEQS